MNKLFRISKKVMLMGLPCIMAVCLLIRYYYPHWTAVDWVYFMAFTGFVGIATNIIAIRMLFHPKEPAFLGLQGLIPKNKPIIAEKIAEETEKRLLNSEIIMDHIDKGRIIEDTISLVTKEVEDYLARRKNRKEIADIIIKFYDRYADKIFMWLIRWADGWLSDLVRRPDTIEALWEALKPQLKKFFESEKLKHKTSRLIIHSLVERSPELAYSISQSMERYIQDQVPWKKTLLKIVKEFFDLEKGTIEDLVLKVLDSPGTYNQITRIIESNLHNIEEYLEQDEVHKKLEEMLDWLKSSELEANREKAIPALRGKINSFLENDLSWDVIDRCLVSVMNALNPRLKAYLNRPESIKKIRRVIPYAITKLNIRKIVAENIKEQDSDEFEQMLMKMTAENFAVIEALGGFLGILAGLTIKSLQLL